MEKQQIYIFALSLLKTALHIDKCEISVLYATK